MKWNIGTRFLGFAYWRLVKVSMVLVLYRDLWKLIDLKWGSDCSWFCTCNSKDLATTETWQLHGSQWWICVPGDYVICCEEERQEKNEKVMGFFFSNCWIFIFPHVTHLLKNERKLEIFKLEVSLSHFLFILWSIDFNIISYHIIYYIILNIKKKIAEFFLEF